FECPYCGRLHPILEQLRERNPDVRFVFRHFPLRDMHPRAVPAALVAEAAAQQGRFWEMHDLLYAHQRELGDEDLARYAAELGVARPVPIAPRSARIARDERSGRASGVRGTPTLFINGVRYSGKLDLAAIGEAIQQARPAPSPRKAP